LALLELEDLIDRRSAVRALTWVKGGNLGRLLFIKTLNEKTQKAPVNR